MRLTESLKLAYSMTGIIPKAGILEVFGKRMIPAALLPRILAVLLLIGIGANPVARC